MFYIFVLILVILMFVGCWKYVDWKNAKTAERVEKRLAKMSQSEKDELLWGDSWKTINGSLPKTCPKCSSQNYSKNSVGYPISKWILVSSETIEVEKFDKAYRLGGATIAFTKTETKEIKTYKCPECGFTHTAG